MISDKAGTPVRPTSPEVWLKQMFSSNVTRGKLGQGEVGSARGSPARYVASLGEAKLRLHTTVSKDLVS